jgi:hypothetical protein
LMSERSLPAAGSAAARRPATLNAWAGQEGEQKWRWMWHTIFKYGGGCIMVWVCLSSTRTRELSTGKVLEENLVQSSFQHTLGDNSTI